MTSSDGGGSGNNYPHSDGQNEGPRGPSGLPHHHDPVRLTPPADPWLTDAHTSALGDAPALRDLSQAPPTADTAPYGSPTSHLADTAPYGGPTSHLAGGPPRRRRRVTPWVAGILAAAVLFLAGMLADDQFGADDDGALGPAPSKATSAAPTRTGGGQKPTPTASRPAAPVGGAPSTKATTSASASADTSGVVYEVTASGSRNRGSVTYTDEDGEFIRLHGIALPWRRTVPLGPEREPLILNSQRKGGGDAGPVTCTITVNGKLLSSTTAHGKYASAQCSASG